MQKSLWRTREIVTIATLNPRVAPRIFVHIECSLSYLKFAIYDLFNWGVFRC